MRLRPDIKHRRIVSAADEGIASRDPKFPIPLVIRTFISLAH